MHCASRKSFRSILHASLRGILTFVLLLSSLLCVASPPESQQRVAEILVERCLACHGPTKQEGGYRVDSFQRLRMPGDSGAQAIADGKPGASELMKRLTTDDVDMRMPSGVAALTSTQIAAFEKWISAGAKSDAEYESKPIVTWARTARKVKSPEHYPAPLPIVAIALSSSADGMHAWTNGYGEVLKWNLLEPEQQLVQRVAIAGVHVSGIQLSADDRLLAVASGAPGTQGFVEVFIRRESSYELAWTHTCSDVPADMAISPDAAQLAIGQSDGTLVIVDLVNVVETKQPGETNTRVLSPHADAILAVAWSEKGDRLITGARDRTAKIFDTSKWQLIANYDRHERAVGGVAYLDRYPVSLDETGKLRLWSGDDSDRTLAERDNQARFLEHVVARQGRVWFAVGPDLRSFEIERKTVDDGKDDAGKPKQKTTTRWKVVEDLASSGADWSLSMDVNSKFVVSGTESGRIVLWKLGERQPLRVFLAKP